MPSTPLKQEELKMKTTNQSTREAQPFSLATRAWAGLCHNCGICAYANRKPDSAFNKVMIWHREWCPGWNSHNKVYGVKSL
jgi:hypothetical protein